MVLRDISVCYLDTMPLLIHVGRKCHISYSSFLFDLGKVAIEVKMSFFFLIFPSIAHLSSLSVLLLLDEAESKHCGEGAKLSVEPSL